MDRDREASHDLAVCWPCPVSILGGSGYGNIFLNCTAVSANFLPGICHPHNHRRHSSNGTTKALYHKSFRPILGLNSRFSGRASPSAEESRNEIMPLRRVTWSPPCQQLAAAPMLDLRLLARYLDPCSHDKHFSTAARTIEYWPWFLLMKALCRHTATAFQSSALSLSSALPRRP